MPGLFGFDLIGDLEGWHHPGMAAAGFLRSAPDRGCGSRAPGRFIDSAIADKTAIVPQRHRFGGVAAQPNRGQTMKLIIGRPDETEVVLAEEVNGSWKPNPNIASEMVSFLQGADPEQFEMWVEEPE
jgi:hypothetical protein